MRWYHPNGRKWRGTKEPLDEGERGVWRAGLTLNTQKTMIMASGHIISWQIEGGNVEAVTHFIFLDSKITGDGDYSHEIKRHFLLGKKAMTNLDSILTVETQVHIVKAMVFSVVKYGCESWTIKRPECRKVVVFELWCWGTLQSPLDCKETKSTNPKGDQTWIFIRRTHAEAEASIFWSPDEKSQLTGKDYDDAGKDWGQEEKQVTENEMVGQYQQINEHEFEETLWDSKGQGSLVCCAAIHGVAKNQTWFID